MNKSESARRAELQERLAAFEFDDSNAERPFSARLAAENGWTPAFTALAIEEYRKFLFIAATCPHPAAPSNIVDKVWHLHLVYTRSYWDDLCRNVLGMSLHHHPSRGGSLATEECRKNYRTTLDSYRAEFGEPPVSIWPTPPPEPAAKPPEREQESNYCNRDSNCNGGCCSCS